MKNTEHILRVFPNPGPEPGGLVQFRGKSYPCALGKAGIGPGSLKSEGDHSTPSGLFFPKRLLFRPDRITNIDCPLCQAPLTPKSGWCDDPASPDYNRLVALPHAARCETLWHDDHVYDLILTISHNDRPAVPGKGSAIFFHIAKENFSPTEGCVALEEKDFLEILKALSQETLIRIHHNHRP